MSGPVTIAVPGKVSETATGVVTAARRVECSLGQFATLARLRAMPREIDAAILALRMLRHDVVSLRNQAADQADPARRQRRAARAWAKDLTLLNSPTTGADQ